MAAANARYFWKALTNLFIYLFENLLPSNSMNVNIIYIIPNYES